MPADTRLKLSARARVQTDKVTGKPALVYPEGVLLMNPSGSAIVALCDGTKTETEIASTLTARFQAPSGAIEKDVAAFLERLRERNLLETPDDARPA